MMTNEQRNHIADRLARHCDEVITSRLIEVGQEDTNYIRRYIAERIRDRVHVVEIEAIRPATEDKKA